MQSITRLFKSRYTIKYALLRGGAKQNNQTR